MWETSFGAQQYIHLWSLELRALRMPPMWAVWASCCGGNDYYGHAALPGWLSDPVLCGSSWPSGGWVWVLMQLTVGPGGPRTGS